MAGTDGLLAQLLNPEFRRGDNVTVAPSGRLTQIDIVTDGIATGRWWHRSGPAVANVADLTHLGGSPHPARRPDHPHCLAHAVAGCQARPGPWPEHSPWIVVHGWPTPADKAAQTNWRWAQACADHADLATAFVRTWVGLHGYVDSEPGWPADLRPAEPLLEQLALF